ncbi:MAG TPA: hypothetical protein VFT34_12500 [Verrucomicrobiae bacterium]|nr:hypothetical protein [Verrucomicrobiae bacterium]
MRPEEFKRLLEQRPFVPFRIYVTGGSTYDILHEDFVMLGRALVTIGAVVGPDGFVDQVVHVPLIHINKIEMLQPA